MTNTTRPFSYASVMTAEQLREEIGDARARLAGYLPDDVRICVQARLNTLTAERNARSH